MVGEVVRVTLGLLFPHETDPAIIPDTPALECVVFSRLAFGQGTGRARMFRRSLVSWQALGLLCPCFSAQLSRTSRWVFCAHPSVLVSILCIGPSTCLGPTPRLFFWFFLLRMGLRKRADVLAIPRQLCPLQ